MPQKTQFQSIVSSTPKRNQEMQVNYSSLPSIIGIEPEKPATPPIHYLWILRRHLLKMVAFVAAGMLIIFIVSARLKPIYESTATINVNLTSHDGVIGQGSTTPTITQDSDVLLATQIRLIEPDAVLRPVAEPFHLLDKDQHAATPGSPSGQTSVGAPVRNEIRIPLKKINDQKPT